MTRRSFLQACFASIGLVYCESLPAALTPATKDKWPGFVVVAGSNVRFWCDETFLLAGERLALTIPGPCLVDALGANSMGGVVTLYRKIPGGRSKVVEAAAARNSLYRWVAAEPVVCDHGCDLEVVANADGDNLICLTYRALLEYPAARVVS